MIADKPRMTYAQFERYAALPENADRALELIDGELHEKMPTEEHGMIILRLGGKLIVFVDGKALGIVTTDARHRLPDEDEHAYRPDISYTSFARKQAVVTQGEVPLMPDLAIEVQSPNDSANKLRRKASYYLDNGSLLVWLIFPAKRKIEVWEANGDLTTLTLNDTLTGGDVLPGFSIPVKAIFVV